MPFQSVTRPKSVAPERKKKREVDDGGNYLLFNTRAYTLLEFWAVGRGNSLQQLIILVRKQ
jgi:hypothetical protein